MCESFAFLSVEMRRGIRVADWAAVVFFVQEEMALSRLAEASVSSVSMSLSPLPACIIGVENLTTHTPGPASSPPPLRSPTSTAAADSDVRVSE